MPSNFWPSTFAAAVSSSIRSRLIGGSWPGLSPLPTKPGHMALWSFGEDFTDILAPVYGLVDLQTKGTHAWFFQAPFLGIFACASGPK